MEEEGWEARCLLVLAVLNDEVYCDLKSGSQLAARVSFSLALKEEGRREESFSRAQEIGRKKAANLQAAERDVRVFQPHLGAAFIKQRS